MNEQFQEVSLRLWVALRNHLVEAEKLKRLLDRALALAPPPPSPPPDKGREEGTS